MKLGITWCYLLFMLINHKNSNLFVNGKSLENQNLASCHEHVSEFFKSFLNVTIQPSEKVGKFLLMMIVIVYRFLLYVCARLFIIINIQTHNRVIKR